MAAKATPIDRLTALLLVGLTAALAPACAQAAAHDAAHASAKPAAEPLDPARMLLALRPSIMAAEAIDAKAPAAAATIEPAAPQPAAILQPAVQPYRLTADAVGRRNEVECLAAAVHYEAANQGQNGQAAVAQVVLNRLNDPRFPKTVCGVVFQGSTRSTGCQFTFTCDGSLRRRPSGAAWKRAEDVAEQALDGYVMADVGAATHYHTVWVHPYWSPTLVKVAQIGAHIFYRAPGAHAPGAYEVAAVRMAAAATARTPALSRAKPSRDGFTAWGLSIVPPQQPDTTVAW